jgi:acetoin utilization deacetylase AcuC-like enzyme
MERDAPPKFGLVDHPAFLLHRSRDHVERPERLEAVREALAPLRQQFEFVDWPARPATDDELLLVHEPEVLARIEDLTAAGGGHLDPDTYVNQHSDQAARLAVGGGIDLCRAVMKGELDRGFLLARPPGHHATPTHSMGFCLYSTIAIVAKACSDLCERILILDWDVHHGNGTQDCLYRDGGTCFISLHQAPFYPGTGHPGEIGEGPGEGLTYNLPLPSGCGDAEYLATYSRLVRPIIRRYDPQLILVSAGYDAHRKDPLGGMDVSTEGFAQLAALVAEDAKKTSANGRLVGFLEGGYDLHGVSSSLSATLRVWTGLDAAAPPEPPEPVDEHVLRLLGLAEKRFLSPP